METWNLTMETLKISLSRTSFILHIEFTDTEYDNNVLNTLDVPLELSLPPPFFTTSQVHKSESCEKEKPQDVIWLTLKCSTKCLREL